jgi:hypothetical protein
VNRRGGGVPARGDHLFHRLDIELAQGVHRLLLGVDMRRPRRVDALGRGKSDDDRGKADGEACSDDHDARHDAGLAGGERLRFETGIMGGGGAIGLAVEIGSAVVQLDGDGDAVADARHRLDDRPVMAVVAERQAQLADGGGKRGFDDVNLRPDAVEKLVLGDDLARLEEQFAQQFEGLGLDRDAPSVDDQCPVGLVKNGAGKQPPALAKAASAVQSSWAFPRPFRNPSERLYDRRRPLRAREETALRLAKAMSTCV